MNIHHCSQHLHLTTPPPDCAACRQSLASLIGDVRTTRADVISDVKALLRREQDQRLHQASRVGQGHPQLIDTLIGQLESLNPTSGDVRTTTTEEEEHADASGRSAAPGDNPTTRHEQAMRRCLNIINHLTAELLAAGAVHHLDDSPCEHEQSSGVMCVNPLHLRRAPLSLPPLIDQARADLEMVIVQLQDNIKADPSMSVTIPTATINALIAAVSAQQAAEITDQREHIQRLQAELDATEDAQHAREAQQATLCSCGTTLVCPDIGCDKNKVADVVAQQATRLQALAQEQDEARAQFDRHVEWASTRLAELEDENTVLHNTCQDYKHRLKQLGRTP